METNTAAEQNKNVKLFESLWNQSAVVSFRLLMLRSGTAYQMMSPPLRPCQPSGAIWRHTYSAAVTTPSDSAHLLHLLWL